MHWEYILSFYFCYFDSFLCLGYISFLILSSNAVVRKIVFIFYLPEEAS